MEKLLVRTIENVSAMIEEQEPTNEDLMGFPRQMMEIRALEDNVSEPLNRGILKGASHLYAGQKAVAVGAIGALRDDDLIISTHRGYGHAHAHGDRAAKTSEERQEHYNRMMAEVVAARAAIIRARADRCTLPMSRMETREPQASLLGISP